MSALQAHHGLATFDTTKSVTIEGSVSEWQWTNPHVYLYVDVAGAQGTAKWRIEFGSIGNMRVRGFSRTSFKIGDKVRVTGSPRRDGFTEMFFRQGSLGDGQPFPGQQPAASEQPSTTSR